jgi:hypothetical protein
MHTVKSSGGGDIGDVDDVVGDGAGGVGIQSAKVQSQQLDIPVCWLLALSGTGWA